MHNALVKQSIEHVDAIIAGIHKVDDKKVMSGLKGLSNIDFSEIETPLSPFFDLVTGISHGREDFLSLERKHLLALVIRDMAQAVYQWAQKSNKGVAHVTKDELTTKLEKLIELLEPTKAPCISAITNLNCAKAIASCLAMPTSSEDEVWNILLFVGECIAFSSKNAEKIKDEKDKDRKEYWRIASTTDLAFKLIQRAYQAYKHIKDLSKANNEQALVMQIATVDAWKEIIHIDKDTTKSSKEQVEKILESLRQYFEEGISGQKSIKEYTTPTFKAAVKRLGEATARTFKRTSKKAKDAITKLVQAAPPYRKRLIELLYGEIVKLEDILDNSAAGRDIEALRNLAFHALVDLYVETGNTNVQCEILKVFGGLARCLCEQGPLSDEQLSSLIRKESKVDTIEQAAFRILVEAIWPTVLENQDKPVALSLTSGKAVELSKKWKIRCMAIEELLRFEDHYLDKRNKSNKKTPISSFLDKMGREYQVIALLLNKFRLDEREVKSLRDFLHHAKGSDKTKELLRKAFSLQEADINKFLTNKDKDTVKEILVPKFKEKGLKEESIANLLQYFLKKNNNDAQRIFHLAQKLTIETSDIDLISDFLRGDISQKGLVNKEKNIKAWLGKKLKLQDTECDKLIDFLKKDKDPREQSKQEKYSDEPVRPVLDKLIDQFRLIKAERALIDEAIFKGQRGHTAQESMIEKVGEALKSFFGQDNYSNIACAFNNLDRIKEMIKAEKRLG
ncbi:MAG: hypothetical protein AAF392_01385 [Bacteroidota bacterium]